MALLVHKICGGFFFCQNLFPAILRLKKKKKKMFLFPLSSRGMGGKALDAGPLKKELYFFAASLIKARKLI